MKHHAVLTKNSRSPRILVYNKDFYLLSETFIYRQVKSLRQAFTVDLMGFALRNKAYFSNDCRFIKIGTNAEKVELKIRNFLKRMFNIRYRYTWNTLFILHNYFRFSNAIVHAHYGWNGLYLLRFLKKKGIPLVVSFHGNDASGLLRNPNYKTKLPELFEYVSHIILCSEHMIRMLDLEAYLEKVSVIPYGINVNEYKPHSIQEQTPVVKILHTGRIVAKKGVPDLIRVFASLKDKYPAIVLQIVGDGDEKSLCEQLVSDLKLVEDVTFFGAQPQVTVKELMNSCDIFVLNSRTDHRGDMEGFPNAILEAMAFERPVISTRHAGIPMAVEHGETGLLVDEYDQPGLYNAIERLILDVNLRIQFGQNGRKKVVEQFTEEIMSASLVTVFKEKILT